MTSLAKDKPCDIVKYMIDILETLIDTQDKEYKQDRQVSSEEGEAYCKYFNKRLIVPEIRDHFNVVYEMRYKCLICYDVVYDPVYCSECQLVFCKSCVTVSSTQSLNNIQKNKNLLCDHTNIFSELSR